MRSLTFGDYNTVEDWGAILNAKVVADPVPKTNYVTVPGHEDGELDLSEALTGTVLYNNRNASFTLILAEGTHAERIETIRQIKSAVHGRKIKIYDPDDYPDHYLYGRLSVSEVVTLNAYATVKIDGILEPWRYALYETIRDITITGTSGTQTVTLDNRGDKTVTPTLTVTGALVLHFTTLDGTEASRVLGSGTYKIPRFKLAPGVSTITLSGAGTVSIKYREAIF